MKILFLDIDGVCNSEAYARARAKPGMLDIDPDAAARVKRIIAETGCKVILSSSWRHDTHLRGDVRKLICEFLDITGTALSRFRGREVNEWLVNHGQTVQNYAILDDDSDFWPWQPLFRTTFKTGLTDEIAEKVINYLNGKEPYGRIATAYKAEE